MKKTILLKVDAHSPEPEKMRIAANLIRRGGLVAFPTETVYGLGANALNPEAVRALFRAKRRPFDNPPIVHIGREKEVYRLAERVSAKAKKLMKVFWPGPLTLVFNRTRIVPDVTVAGLNTIAVRMPKQNVALALIRESGCPISAPSANLAGKPSPTTAKHVLDDLGGKIDAVLDSGPTTIGIESTVLDLTVDPPEVLRPGGITYEALIRTIGKVVLSPVAAAEIAVRVEKVRSPGLKHRHYAPEAEMFLVEGELEAMIHRVIELIETGKADGKKVGVLATDETVGHYKADILRSLGSRDDMASIARNVFKLLREFDAENVDLIIAEGLPLEGLGLAVMNRLRKAASYNIVKANETPGYLRLQRG